MQKKIGLKFCPMFWVCCIEVVGSKLLKMASKNGVQESAYLLRDDSQIDFGMPNVNLTYGGGGVQPMTFGKRSKIS